MLHTIRRRPDGDAPGDAVDALLECHRRIRHFTAVAAALPEATTASAAEIAEAAAGVARYFAVALPLHSTDEEVSIAPRLLAHAPAEALRAALAAMERQHDAIDATLASALPRWRAVADDPACLPAHAAALRGLAARLAAQWEEHLALEEATIFPAMRALLPSSEMNVIQVEMRARRASPA
ncbi:MAG: hemerythrin domain-containing protein [Minicystis sp.]